MRIVPGQCSIVTINIYIAARRVFLGDFLPFLRAKALWDGAKRAEMYMLRERRSFPFKYMEQKQKGVCK